MDSSDEHKLLINSTYGSSDSDDSSDSNHSIEQPPSIHNGVPPEESLIRNINLFTSLFDSSISELQNQINKLKEITERVEKIHRNTTIGSLSGGVISAVGGILTIVGLALTPFTLGASLIVTGVGVGVAVSGGVAGAASNITDLINQKVSRTEIEKILKTVQDKLPPILKHLEEIEIRLDEIQQFDPTDPSGRKAQIGFGLGRGVGYSAELLRLVNVVEIGKVTAQVSRTVKAAGAVTGVLAGLFLVLDVVFVVKDAKELYNINNGNGKSAISKFIKGMKVTVGQLTETLDQLQGVRNRFNA
ncbi:apolipoprotein L2-like [Astyanax mexicanus]|uniref:apolipoprotein L2-like n=1 Tax=Astyanax mexicanus TaxID=7994 RepID=UPI0020CAC638|nr:apolipoprotein L2-like [Astyanax mexicanus]